MISHPHASDDDERCQQASQCKDCVSWLHTACNATPMARCHRGSPRTPRRCRHRHPTRQTDAACGRCSILPVHTYMLVSDRQWKAGHHRSSKSRHSTPVSARGTWNSLLELFLPISSLSTTSSDHRTACTTSLVGKAARGVTLGAAYMLTMTTLHTLYSSTATPTFFLRFGTSLSTSRSASERHTSGKLRRRCPETLESAIGHLHIICIASIRVACIRLRLHTILVQNTCDVSTGGGRLAARPRLNFRDGHLRR